MHLYSVLRIYLLRNAGIACIMLQDLFQSVVMQDKEEEYEIDRFYDPSSNSIPPPPDSTSNNSIPSPPASTSQGKKGLKRNVIIIISIVPIAVSVILIVCVCIFLRARRKQKGEEEEEEEAEVMEKMERWDTSRHNRSYLDCWSKK
ncbi:hypothetical protein NC653_027089 [Populus alba x Populus x berolinensis]|uniref:Uncharacterized protein n=1 Tax=Populus alba x Populus x berolinensis TaxID=444605 RepID=A0AAD6Q4M7_9ROSI|nr:hypothetical protein NC653_027089 [Populus alba x Populus x berolinensis]